MLAAFYRTYGGKNIGRVKSRLTHFIITQGGYRRYFYKNLLHFNAILFFRLNAAPIFVDDLPGCRRLPFVCNIH